MHPEELAWVLAVVLVTPAALAAQKPVATVTVCEVLANAQKFDGQVVRVRGVLRDSNPAAKEPAYDELIADGGPGLEPDQAVIRVETPDVHFLERPPQDYKPDMDSARRLEEIIARMVATGQRAMRFSLAVEGVFYRGGPKPEPSERPRHRWYPGYIVIQAYRDVKPL